MVLFYRSYTTSYQSTNSTIVIVAVSCIVYKLFDVENWYHSKAWVWFPTCIQQEL